MNRLLLLLILISITQVCLASMKHYVGHIGKYPVQMDVTIDKDGFDGFYFYENKGLLIWLRGKIDKIGHINVDELQGDPTRPWIPTDKINASFRVEITNDGDINGVWEATNSSISYRVHLHCVAGYSLSTTRKNGVAFTVVTPQWIEKPAGEHELNLLLAKSVQEDKDIQLSDKVTGDIWQATAESEYFYAVYYYSKQFVSFKVDVTVDPGLHNPPQFTFTKNYLFVDGHWKELKLTDIFNKSEVVKVLSIVNTDLRSQGVHFDHKLTIKDINYFLATPKNVFFIFSPYEIERSQEEYIVNYRYSSPILSDIKGD